MPNYRRPHVSGGIYFITQVTYQRDTWLYSDMGRKALREGIEKVREKYPYNPVRHGFCENLQECDRTLDGEEVEIIAKLSRTGKVVIITVYAL